MKNFTADMSALEKENARAIFAYEIAKIICERVSSYSEMLDILDTIRLQFDIARELTELKLEDAPRNKWRKKLAAPEAEDSGTVRVEAAGSIGGGEDYERKQCGHSY